MAKTSTSFVKGDPRAGRPKGVQNKINKTVKETVLEVFNQLQTKPKVNLVEWAVSEPTEFYRMATKLIPTEVSGSVKHVIKVTIDE